MGGVGVKVTLFFLTPCRGSFNPQSTVKHGPHESNMQRKNGIFLYKVRSEYNVYFCYITNLYQLTLFSDHILITKPILLKKKQR